MRLALIQMNVVEKNKTANVKHGLELLNSVEKSTDVAVLPEVWTTGYSLGALSKEAERLDGDLVKELSKLAKAKQLGIVAGSFALRKEDGKIYNTTLAFDNMGNLIADYDKIHMFSLYKEQKFFAYGNKKTLIELVNMKAGFSICYDLRFPELFRSMALDGAQIVYLPAEWPAPRGADWQLLVRARAVENQMYMCAVNCVGKFKDMPFYGHSLLVAPDGEVVVEGSGEEEVLYANVQIDLVDSIRSKMNVLKDVRKELY